jgi:predicted MFS family arabinose efflux permease
VLWFGAFTSTIGTWMQKVAQSWLVLTITGSSSAFFLGLDSFLGELPILLLTLVGGVVADRYDRKRLLLSSQCIQMAAAFTLAALVYWDVVRIWHVLALSVVTGLAQAFGGPAYQSLLPSLVSKNDVPNAIAFNSIQFNLARVNRSAARRRGARRIRHGGVLRPQRPVILAVIVAILLLHVRHTPPTAKTRMHHELKSGFEYARTHPALLSLAVLGFSATFLGGPLLTFLPLFAQNVLHGGVTQYTHLMSFAGAGAVTGALVVAWLGKFRQMGRTLLILQVVFGVLIALFAVTRIFWINAVLLFGCAACMVMVFAMLSSLVQLNAPNEMRGRVMSIYMVAFRGGSPLGGLVGGWAATLAGAPSVLIINGLLLSLVATWFLTRSGGIREI